MYEHDEHKNEQQYACMYVCMYVVCKEQGKYNDNKSRLVKACTNKESGTRTLF